MISNDCSNRNLPLETGRDKVRGKLLNIEHHLTSQDRSLMAQPHVIAAPSDAALIAAWQRGDEQAAAALVGRHARALARYLSAAGAPEAEVDDLVQESFIRAFRSVDRFRGQCQFRTWLLTIGGNVLKDYGRRASRRKVVPLDEQVRDLAGDPHEQAVASEAEARLAAGLKVLPRLQREVFLLRAQHGLEYQEIAAALATTPGAARVHYHHAVRRLKEIVG
jgi:RNA polymerase sigma-70 factor (ECF subfamily)